MRRRSDNGNNKTIHFFFVLFFVCFFWGTAVSAKPAPYLANYYLNTLQNSSSFIERMARYDVLILTPTQIVANKHIVQKIHAKNPDVIILAYVPSQSYNVTHWTKDSVYKNLIVDSSWWLKSSSGTVISAWADIKNINMDPAWTEYLISYVNDHVASLSYVDGIFFDMVSENISWINAGDVDVNSDGKKDAPHEADALWLKRTQYFFSYVNDHLDTTYVVMNGTSHPSIQPFVNGRMFETFPTPWEGNGTWQTVMTNIQKNKKANKEPVLTIINGNTNNQGNKNEFQKMRIGLGSSLLEDNVMFSFDHGDQDHGQLWWYDEYDVDLGEALGSAVSQTKQQAYAPDVWKREFDHGMTLVNSTEKKQTVLLDGEFEKIHGTQYLSVNDGSIISEITLPGNDAIILMKTLEDLEDVVYTNGDFVRFFRANGERVRNGFFAFDSAYDGGAQLASVDLDGNGKRELMAVRRGKILIWKDDGQLYMRRYPYGASYQGTMKIAIGDINWDGYGEIYVAPKDGYPLPIKIYTRHGRQMFRDWYPFGETDDGGDSLAVARTEGQKNGTLLVGSGKGRAPDVYVYSSKLDLFGFWPAFESSFLGGISVAAGDVDGDGDDDVIVGSGPGKKPFIHIFDQAGKTLFPAFEAYASFGTPGIEVQARDVDFNGKDDVVAFGSGF